MLGGVIAAPQRPKAAETRCVFRDGNFDADYRAATKLLKSRMDKRFPDNYHARMSLNANNTYDHGEDRATAVDTASTAIAMALREGATVQQAADAAAASIGI